MQLHAACHMTALERATVYLVQTWSEDDMHQMICLSTMTWHAFWRCTYTQGRSKLQLQTLYSLYLMHLAGVSRATSRDTTMASMCSRTHDAPARCAITPRSKVCSAANNPIAHKKHHFTLLTRQQSHSIQLRPFTVARRAMPLRCIAAASGPLKVAVTGAGGRTGSLTVKRLLAEPDKYNVVAIVRSPEVRPWDGMLPSIGACIGQCTSCAGRSRCIPPRCHFIVII